MLTQLRCPVRLSLRSTDGLLESCVETVGTLDQILDHKALDHKASEPQMGDRYHLLLTEPLVQEFDPFATLPISSVAAPAVTTPRLLWLEFSPYRVAMTMQGNGQFSYRHLFEPSVFGVSRYWLQEDGTQGSSQICLRNFARTLHLKGHPLPRFLLLEYELWSGRLNLGQYVLELEIQHEG